MRRWSSMKTWITLSAPSLTMFSQTTLPVRTCDGERAGRRVWHTDGQECCCVRDGDGLVRCVGRHRRGAGDGGGGCWGCLSDGLGCRHALKRLQSITLRDGARTLDNNEHQYYYEECLVLSLLGGFAVHASTRVCARSSLLDPKRLWLHRSIAEQVGITHRTVHRRGCNHCNHCCCLGQPQPPRTWAENRHRCCCCCLCAASRRHMRVSLDCVLALQALHRWAAQHYSLRPEIFPPSLPFFANPAGPRPTHHDRPSQQQPAPVPASDTRPAPRQSITATPPRQGPIHVP